ncbi:MAG TPA: hypothetical protein ENK13_05480 [Thermopetrobacter sp.]|nr:hypothetical protein [Thermopetrobacter sp.]
MAMPERWRRRLLGRFRRLPAFRETLEEMAGDGRLRRSSLSALVDEIAAMPTADLAAVTDFVARRLAQAGLDPVGGRGPEEIARRLLEKVEDRRTLPLSRADVARIDALLAVSGEPRAATERLAALVEDDAGHFARAVAECRRRLELLETALEGLAEVRFATDFGRDFDYYTGFVFQIEARIDGRDLPVAGGGRYDDLLASLGGPDVPACGFGIHTGRLLRAAGGAT